MKTKLSDPSVEDVDLADVTDVDYLYFVDHETKRTKRLRVDVLRAAVGGGGGGGPPTAHAASHASGGSDPVTPASIGAPTVGDLTAHTTSTANPHAVTASQAGAVPLMSPAPAAGRLLTADGSGALADSGILASAIPAASSATPQPLGVAGPGAGTDYARPDHVHAMPTSAQVGAAALRIATGTPITASINTSALAHDTQYDVSSAAGAVVLTVSATSRTAGDEMKLHVSNIANAITLSASGVTITYYGANTITTVGDVITLWWRTTTEVVATIVRKA